MQLLKSVYPTIDWTRVYFYEGLPWFTPAVAPYVTAQALPRFYSFGGYNIYMRRFDETRAQCLADMLHEAYHVMQAMSFLRGYGIGFIRVWLIYYLAEFMRHGYRGNVFEVPAYNQEYRFLGYCSRLGIKGVIDEIQPDTLSEINREKEIIFREFRYSYRGRLLELTGSFIVCIAVTLVKPAADAAVYLLGSPFILKRIKRNKRTFTMRPHPTDKLKISANE